MRVDLWHSVRISGFSGDLRAFVGNAKDEGYGGETVDDICKYLNVSNETAYKWIEQRAMPGHRVGRRWVFKQDEGDEWGRSGGAADKADKPDAER